MSKDLVIVESPTKAKTISSYLGNKLNVMASYGHIRDLISKEGAVEPANKFKMNWNVTNSKQLTQIAQGLKDAKTLYLATDPDREGEAIAWHLVEYLKEKKLPLPNIQRVVFHEITSKAIKDAFNAPLGLNEALIEAYLARRALDHLFGFTLSPILWRRLPGSRSAGRVQSVAVRLIAEREAERLAFKAVAYWSIKAKLEYERKQFEASLAKLNGEKVDKFFFKQRAAAEKLVAGLKTLKVTGLETASQNVSPPPPFTTSTLQQVAANRLGFSSAKTMQVAQRLYEGFSINGKQQGLITYMRTDSVNISKIAVVQSRDAITKIAGKQFLPATPNSYKSKAKNAQEAHEAIRPTDFMRRSQNLPEDAAKLYELIWQRAMASQAKTAVINRSSILLQGEQGTEFKATGSTIGFEGFLRFYPNQTKGDDEQILPSIKKGQTLEPSQFEIGDHETKPPPRYTEATLVKTLEEKGIGRPSTYASIISTVQERGYAEIVKKQFAPTALGMVTAAFFSKFFKPYVEYNFTAQMEDTLDKISNGSSNRLELLQNFWKGLTAIAKQAENISMREVISALEQECIDLIFPVPEGKTRKEVRKCPKCGKQLNLKLGRHGPFIGCSGYPECKYMSGLSDQKTFSSSPAENTELGEALGGTVSLRNGPYGPYFQLDKKGAPLPKRVSVPKHLDSAAITLELAAKYLELPRSVGTHPEGGDIKAGIGRFGPYVLHNKVYASLSKEDDVLTVGLNRAVALLEEKKNKTSKYAPRLALETYEQDGKKIELFDGKYGKYLKQVVKNKAVNASLPKGLNEDELNFEIAQQIIEKKLKAPKRYSRK